MISEIAHFVRGLKTQRGNIPIELPASATDSLGLPNDNDDASAMLANLSWERETFAIARVETAGRCDVRLTFPSPHPQGSATNDRVVLDWLAARDRSGDVARAPGVLVLDILQGGNLISGLVGRVLAANGVHAFLLHMPHNRARADRVYNWGGFLPDMKQAIGDARRARDVIAALPYVVGKVGIQGTSLGGFIATVAASMDAAFSPIVISLAGGNGFGVLTEGRLDAAMIRQKLREHGYDDPRLRQTLHEIEPLRVACRLDPRKTWLISARRDQVVPAAYSRALAAAVRLEPSHHRLVGGCHYTCAVNAPRMLAEVVRIFRAPLMSAETGRPTLAAECG